MAKKLTIVLELIRPSTFAQSCALFNMRLKNAVTSASLRRRRMLRRHCRKHCVENENKCYIYYLVSCLGFLLAECEPNVQIPRASICHGIFLGRIQ